MKRKQHLFESAFDIDTCINCGCFLDEAIQGETCMEMADKKVKKQKKLKAKKDESNTPFKAKSIVPSKSQRGFSSKKPEKAHLSYPL